MRSMVSAGSKSAPRVPSCSASSASASANACCWESRRSLNAAIRDRAVSDRSRRARSPFRVTAAELSTPAAVTADSTELAWACANGANSSLASVNVCSYSASTAGSPGSARAACSALPAVLEAPSMALVSGVMPVSSSMSAAMSPGVPSARRGSCDCPMYCMLRNIFPVSPVSSVIFAVSLDGVTWVTSVPSRNSFAHADSLTVPSLATLRVRPRTERTSTPPMVWVTSARHTAPSAPRRRNSPWPTPGGGVPKSTQGMISKAVDFPVPMRPMRAVTPVVSKSSTTCSMDRTLRTSTRLTVSDTGNLPGAGRGGGEWTGSGRSHMATQPKNSQPPRGLEGETGRATVTRQVTLVETTVRTTRTRSG